MITIIDYGMGNLRSVQKAFELFYSDVRVSPNLKDIIDADKIVLPGVGAFDIAMKELKKRNLVGGIKGSIKDNKPFLGICLGLQLLFSESEEGSVVKGLDILKGRVKRFDDMKFKVPHMGWNNIVFRIRGPKSKIIKGLKDGTFMYFVHSYYAEPEDKSIILCETDYGIKFTSGIQKDNVYAFQFHPEKSQGQGLKIIKNFVEL